MLVEIYEELNYISLRMNAERKSSFLVLGACLLWALDLLVRYPITLKLGFVHIVFLESFLGLLVISPWLLKNGLGELKKFNKKDWFLSAFLGGVGMTVAGFLSTVSIQQATPGTFSFFQIFQPLFVVYAAHVFLKERLDSMYVYWGVWVILSAVLMYSQDLELMFTSKLGALPSDIMVALVTMLIWGLCTITAKSLLKKHSPLSLVAVRWLFAFLFSAPFLAFEEASLPVATLLQWDFAWRFAFMGGVSGLLSMYLYYRGMAQLPAARTSFMELSYPALGMIFSALYTFESMGLMQIIGAASFFAFLILMLSRQESVLGELAPEVTR